MVDGMTLKESIANEKKKWKAMDRKQKFSYYKSYYLIPTIIVVVILIFLVNVILDVTVRRQKVLINIMTINVQNEEDNPNDLSKDILDYIGGEGKETVAVNPQFMQAGGDPNVNTTVRTMLASEAVDFMFVNKDAYEYFAQSGAYADFKLILPEDRFNKWQDCIIYLDYQDETRKETYAAAIDISGTEFAKKYFSDQKDVYFIGVANGQHLDRVQDMLSFIEKQ